MPEVGLKDGGLAADKGFVTTIRTTCPQCGEVDMGPESILLSVEGSGGEGTYSFICPLCATDVEKQADRKIVALLVSAGVCMAGMGEGTEDQRPASIDHRDSQAELTIDDLLTFHELLKDDSYLESFLSQG